MEYGMDEETANRPWVAMLPVALIVVLTVLEWTAVVWLVNDFANSANSVRWRAPQTEMWDGR